MRYVPGMATDDPSKPPDPFLRPRPRPLSGDTETIAHIERVPRPTPVARITRPEEPRRDEGRPDDAPRPRHDAEQPLTEPPRPERRYIAEPPPEPRPERRYIAEPPPEPRPERRAEPPRPDARVYADAPRAPREPEPPRRPAAPVIPRDATDESQRPRLDPRLDSRLTEPLMELKELRWQPKEPRTWEEAGIDEVLAEQLVLRYLTTANTESARQIANDICLNLPLTKDLLERLKQVKLLQHRGATPMGDFIYELTDAGRAKALDYKRLCAYVGPAPVPFSQYLQSVEEQTLRSRTPTPADLERAFADLVVSHDLVARLGPAVASGRALFLHGDPGNGKTSIAERITRCFGDSIWIPHTLLIDGHLVKLYDPATHVAVDPAFKPLTPQERLDRRWVKIERPTVVAGGELTLEMLEIQISATTNICEAPLQLKANCGTLVIDDFGRQRIEPQVLLNRWIFPLERRLDFLRLPDGRKISSPFDPLLIFSTNLEPRDLVDEAFLRRIPYKIQVQDPTEAEFRGLFELVAAKAEVVLARGVVDHLLDRHYKAGGRKLRFCHPRDIILQVVNQCTYERRPKVATAADIDRAVDNYFGSL